MPEVPRQKTLVYPEEVAKEISRNVPGISDQSIAIFLAQWSVETAGGDAMYNFNVGNLASFSDADSFFSLDTGTKGILRADGVMGQGIMHFRSYSSLAEGVTSYLNLLKNHYSAAWSSAMKEDVESFVSGILAGGYIGSNYTQQEATNLRTAIKAQYARFAKWLGATPKFISPSSAYKWPILVGVVGGLGLFLWKRK